VGGKAGETRMPPGGPPRSPPGQKNSRRRFFPRLVIKNPGGGGGGGKVGFGELTENRGKFFPRPSEKAAGPRRRWGAGATTGSFLFPTKTGTDRDSYWEWVGKQNLPGGPKKKPMVVASGAPQRGLVAPGGGRARRGDFFFFCQARMRGWAAKPCRRVTRKTGGPASFGGGSRGAGFAARSRGTSRFQPRFFVFLGAEKTSRFRAPLGGAKFPVRSTDSDPPQRGGNFATGTNRASGRFPN